MAARPLQTTTPLWTTAPSYANDSGWSEAFSGETEEDNGQGYLEFYFIF